MEVKKLRAKQRVAISMLYYALKYPSHLPFDYRDVSHVPQPLQKKVREYMKLSEQMYVVRKDILKEVKRLDKEMDAL